MKSHVQHTSHDDDRWTIIVDRDAPVTMAGYDGPCSPGGHVPPVSDLPDDVLAALREWVGYQPTEAEKAEASEAAIRLGRLRSMMLDNDFRREKMSRPVQEFLSDLERVIVHGAATGFKEHNQW